MREKRLRRICSAYAWGLGLLVLALGVGLGRSCLALYRSGGFTRESIGLYWDRLAPLVWVCLIGIVGGWVLAMVTAWRGQAVAGTDGASSGRARAIKSPSALLKRRAERLRWEAIPADLRRNMMRERKLRRWLAWGAAVICTASLMPGVIWCLEPSRFSVAHLNRDILAASQVILTGAVMALAVATLAVLLFDASAVRELALIKAAVAEVKGEAFSHVDQNDARKPVWSEDPCVIWSVRGILAAVAVVLVVLGVLNGGMADVLGKAIRICTECIGLG